MCLASGGCVAETSPRPATTSRVVVPMQHSYPIYFLAEVSTIQDVRVTSIRAAQWVPWMELQVLTKANVSSPWQLNFDTGYDGTNHQQPPPLPFDARTAARIIGESPSRLVQPAADEPLIPTVADLLVPPGAVLPKLQGHRRSSCGGTGSP